jgi:hypothetical protein
VYEGYLEFGGNEIINSARTVGYTETAPDCPITWIVCPPCPGLQAALEDQPYVVDNISQAPWYDAEDPTTWRFYGVHALSVEGLPDSTRTASIAEGIADGGVVGNVRHAVRQVRVRALLSARGEDALDAGFSWLDAALQPDECGMHGNACGAVDVCFFVACPPVPGAEGATDEATYQQTLNDLQRRLHNVTCISGPIIEQKIQRGSTFGYIVEFTLAAGTPWVFSNTTEVELQKTLPTVIQDVPFNLIPYPSAELTSGTVVVSTNYSINPSVENAATNWVNASGPLSPSTVAPTPFLTYGRSTELFVHGAGSYRGQLLGNPATGTYTNETAQVSLMNTMTVPGLAPNTRMSFNIWVAALIAAGASGSAINGITVVVQFRSGTSTISETVIGTAAPSDYSGRVYSARSILVPAGTDNLRVIARIAVKWSSSSTPANNSDIRMYADASSVTVP